MTKRKPPRAAPGRFDEVVIARRIRRVRETQADAGVPDREPKQFAAKIGIGKPPNYSNYYKKESGEVPFSIEEAGRCADELGAPPVGSPGGCLPFEDWTWRR
jgi:hypothetical protein